MTRGAFETVAMTVLAPALLVAAVGMWAFDAVRYAITRR